MRGRHSKSAVIEKSMAETSGRAVEKAAETVSELAERAVVAAREAQRVATPALRVAAHTSAETLSHAAERAAGVLAEAADRLAQEVSDMPGPAAKGKGRKAKAAAKAAKPKRWSRRFRRLVMVTTAAGTVYVVVTKTPLKAKLSELVFGPPLEDEEPEPITLPVTESPAPVPPAETAEAAPEGTETKHSGRRAKGAASTAASCRATARPRDVRSSRAISLANQKGQ